MVFPLEVLPVVSVGAALVHLAHLAGAAGAGRVDGFAAACAGDDAGTGRCCFAPLTSRGALAVSWLFAAMGVFFRDLQHADAGTVSLVLMYASAALLPDLPGARQPSGRLWRQIRWRSFAESSRNVAVWGNEPRLDAIRHPPRSERGRDAGRTGLLPAHPKHAFADVM